MQKCNTSRIPNCTRVSSFQSAPLVSLASQSHYHCNDCLLSTNPTNSIACHYLMHHHHHSLTIKPQLCTKHPPSHIAGPTFLFGISLKQCQLRKRKEKKCSQFSKAMHYQQLYMSLEAGKSRGKQEKKRQKVGQSKCFEFQIINLKKLQEQKYAMQGADDAVALQKHSQSKLYTTTTSKPKIKCTFHGEHYQTIEQDPNQLDPFSGFSFLHNVNVERKFIFLHFNVHGIEYMHWEPKQLDLSKSLSLRHEICIPKVNISTAIIYECTCTKS